jgi:putative transposase
MLRIISFAGSFMGEKSQTKRASDMLAEHVKIKAAKEGIVIVEQEESYTSKADISAMDRMPVYGKEEDRPVFSGKRTARGLYMCRKGYTINADCNGAANILQGAFPDAWEGTEDFRFPSYYVKPEN